MKYAEIAFVSESETNATVEDLFTAISYYRGMTKVKAISGFDNDRQAGKGLVEMDEKTT